MKNLTIALDDALLREARVQAASEATTVNALLRDFLVAYVAKARQRKEATDAFLELARRHAGTIEPYTRDELHDG